MPDTHWDCLGSQSRIQTTCNPPPPQVPAVCSLTPFRWGVGSKSGTSPKCTLFLGSKHFSLVRNWPELQAGSACFLHLVPGNKQAVHSHQEWSLGFLHPSCKSHLFSNQLRELVFLMSDHRFAVSNLWSDLQAHDILLLCPLPGGPPTTSPPFLPDSVGTFFTDLVLEASFCWCPVCFQWDLLQCGCTFYLFLRGMWVQWPPTSPTFLSVRFSECAGIFGNFELKWNDFQARTVGIMINSGYSCLISSPRYSY